MMLLRALGVGKGSRVRLRLLWRQLVCMLRHEGQLLRGCLRMLLDLRAQGRGMEMRRRIVARLYRRWLELLWRVMRLLNLLRWIVLLPLLLRMLLLELLLLEEALLIQQLLMMLCMLPLLQHHLLLLLLHLLLLLEAQLCGRLLLRHLDLSLLLCLLLLLFRLRLRCGSCLFLAFPAAVVLQEFCHHQQQHTGAGEDRPEEAVASAYNECNSAESKKGGEESEQQTLQHCVLAVCSVPDRGR